MLKLIGKIKNYFIDTLFNFKLYNLLGIFLVILFSILLGYLFANNFVYGLTFFGAIIMFFVLFLCLYSAEIGLYITVVFSFFAYFLSRLFFNGTMPVGFIYDLFVFTTFLGLMTTGRDFKSKFARFAKTPIVIGILLLLFLMALEYFNPNSRVKQIWFLAFRKFLGYVCLLYIAYSVFDSYGKVKRFIVVLFLVSSAVAVYGCIQQWRGYFDFEWQIILSSPHGMGLIFVNGEFRKFSTFSDAAAYGILMAVCAVFYLIIGIEEKDKFKKWIIISGCIFMILGMGYSGTRTAYAIIIVGLAFNVLLNFHRKATRIFAVIGTIILLALLYAPIQGNKTIERFRTTFKASDDESFKVRVLSRQYIQPYIRAHPIGGGLGTTGATGAELEPDHFLANLQPDSSYLKKAAETGWIGLALICIFYFIILKSGIRGYFKVQDMRFKNLYSASISALFAFYIAEYAQVALGQITDVVVYYPIIAIIMQLKKFDITYSDTN